MKIEIDINDKYIGRDLWVFAGMVPVARKLQSIGVWQVKTKSCRRCGKCCMAINEKHPLGTKTGCRYLQDCGSEFLCGLGYFRPFGCAAADNTIDECGVIWTSIE